MRLHTLEQVLPFLFGFNSEENQLELRVPVYLVTLETIDHLQPTCQIIYLADISN